MVWVLFWIASIGVPAAIRPIIGIDDRTAAVLLGAVRTWPRLPSMTLGVKPRAADALADLVRQLDDLDGAGAVRQAADEAALLQRRDQPVNAGFGPQIERVLHLVERGRNAGFLQPLVDEAQKLELLASEHALVSPGFPPPTSGGKQIMNGHYMFYMCSATL